MITDRSGTAVFQATLAEVVDEEGAIAVFERADGRRFGSVAQQHETAYVYLALAFRGLEGQDRPPISVVVDGKEISAAWLFHFAGHLFREVGQLNRAADAYRRAGVIQRPSDPLAVRSLARAKALYSELGETLTSDRMHVLEWDARRFQAGRPTPLLTLWRVTSRYGTDFWRWLGSLALLGIAFAGSYEALHAYGRIHVDSQWVPALTAAYFFIVTTATVGYGDLYPTDWVGQIVVALNVVLAYALLAIGATILGRKVIGR